MGKEEGGIIGELYHCTVVRGEGCGFWVMLWWVLFCMNSSFKADSRQVQCQNIDVKVGYANATSVQ